MLLFKFACCSPTAFHSSKQHKQEYFGCCTADEHFWHVPGEPCRAVLQLCLWNETTGGEDEVSIQQQTQKSSSLLWMLLYGFGRNVNAPQHPPLSQKLCENSWLQLDAPRVITTQQLHVKKCTARSLRWSNIQFPSFLLKNVKLSCRAIF